MINAKLCLVVLISGNGSNLQAIIDRIAAGKLEAEIAAVISDNAEAYGLQRARHANIESVILNPKEFADKAAYESALQQTIDSYQPKLIVLAGYMRVLGKAIVDHYYGRMINIHPSLLPKHRGLHTHQRALEAGDKEHGVTIHFVSSSVDAGPIIAQAKLNVLADDTVSSLEQRVLQLEHQLYPQVIQWFCEGRVQVET